jgi:membrane protease YdiL (CAAX protease family)
MIDEQQGLAHEPRCPHCQSPLRGLAVFCGQCGQPVVVKSPEPHVDIFERIRPSLLYYFLTLLLLLIYKVTESFPEGFEGMIWITVIDVSLVIIFWWHFSESLGRLLFTRLNMFVLGKVIIGAMAAAFFVTIIADWVNISITDDEFYSPYLFDDTPYPLAFSILFICVQPAIFEEVAFRGFVFNNLHQVTSTTGAIYITSFLFGIMHLSYISLIWLVPLGIISAILRTKYNTLWYGMVAHFTYNLIITLIEFQLL